MNSAGAIQTSISGYLLMKDGTRYRIDNNGVSWIRDANGNKVNVAGNTLTDSLNRPVVLGVDGNGNRTITTKGFNGISRQIKILSAPLSQLIRPDLRDFSLYPTLGKTYTTLFPGLNGSSTSQFNPTLISAVELPDGRKYEFSYNYYGELSKVLLPTGGSYEYDWEAGPGASATGVVWVVDGLQQDFVNIYRRVKEKRIYSSGATLENKTIFIASHPSSGAGPWITTVKTVQKDVNGAFLAGSKHYFYGSPTISMVTYPYDYTDWDEAREYQSETLADDSTSPTLLRRSVQTWQNGPGAPANTVGHKPGISNVRQVESVNTLLDVSPNLVSKTSSINPNNGSIGFDQYNNPTDTWEYDFGAGSPDSLMRQSHTDYLTSGYDTVSGTATSPNQAATIHLRSLPTRTSVYDAGGVEKTRTTIEYDNYTPDTNHAALVNRANISGMDAAFTTSYTTRGNVTATASYANATALTGAITAYSQYDIAGNAVKGIDGKGNATTLDYSDCYGAPNGDAQINSSPSELTNLGQTSYAFPTKVTNALGHIAYSQYDYYLGAVVDTADPNNVKSSVYYDNDALDRPTRGISAVGTSVQNQTNIFYDDNNHVITVAKDKTSYGESAVAANPGGIVSKAYYDGLGRTYRTASKEDGTTWSYKDTKYDALGRAYQASNPYRTTPTEWTTSTFDALGRVTQVSAPDNSIVQSQYSGNVVTVIDQAKKVRRSITDGLGRLLRVDEPTRDFTVAEATQNPLNPDLLLGAMGAPTQPTSYTYDTLDNLLMVTQTGLNASNTSVTQTRSFVYDSLKRLKQATNPESGTIQYTYDNNGNLLTKLDANSITNTYAYDALNRNTTVNYSNTTTITPDLTLIYDTATNGKGRLLESYAGGDATNGTSVEHQKINGYDELGRPLSVTQRYKSNNAWSSSQYTTARTYDLAGNVLSQTNPSGKVLNYTYDQAARLTGFTGNLGDNVTRTYSDNITYNAASLMTHTLSTWQVCNAEARTQ